MRVAWKLWVVWAVFGIVRWALSPELHFEDLGLIVGAAVLLCALGDVGSRTRHS